MDPDRVAACRTDWLGQYTGPVDERTPGLVIEPESTAQVAAALRVCGDLRVPVIPQGGNTGLVGGGVPSGGDEVVMSMRRMNKVRSLDPVARVMECEAGCVLDDLEKAAASHGLGMPLDLGASGSCMIGGNLATHAGGVRFVRHGPLRAHVLGLEVVLAGGRVLDLMTTVRKDNTGYDLKQLFIGSEGTLGVITAAALHLPQRVAGHVALIGAESFEGIVEALGVARHELGETLAAAEFWDRRCMQLLQEQAGLRNPLGEDDASQFYLLVECAGCNADHDMAKLEAFLEQRTTGVLATDESKSRELWALRESITPSLKSAGGHTYKYDVSLPTQEMNAAAVTVQRHLDKHADRLGETRVFRYGHVGDGNLHLNVWSPSTSPAVRDAIESVLYPFITAARGSISAEHGIGQLKRGALATSKDATALDLMAQIKSLLDPHNLVNPGKVLTSRHGATEPALSEEA